MMKDPADDRLSDWTRPERSIRMGSIQGMLAFSIEIQQGWVPSLAGPLLQSPVECRVRGALSLSVSLGHDDDRRATRDAPCYDPISCAFCLPELLPLWGPFD